MAYYCADCSYRGATSGQVGECPACGSYNISKIKRGQKQQTKRSKLSLAALIVLWSILIALIIWKLNS